MPSDIIKCKDCADKKAEIEESGALVVTSCEPLPDQNDIQEDERKCKIKWTYKL